MLWKANIRPSTSYHCRKSSRMKLSVCVTTYNHEPYIRQCLDSILTQETDFDFEIVLGEDDSSDGTRAICQEYATRHPDRIRLFLRNREDVIHINGHPTGRFNFMENMAAARGEYISIIEGDDFFTSPQKLQRQVELLDKHADCSLCFHQAYRWKTYEEDAPSQKMPEHLDKHILKTEDLITQHFIATCSIMFRKKEGFSFPEWYKHAASGDIALMLLLSLEGDLRFIPEVMSCYRIHGQGLSTQHRDYIKVISMIHLYQSFNIHTGFRFHERLVSGMKEEIGLHLPEARERAMLRARLDLLERPSLWVRVSRRIKKAFGI